MAGGVFGHIGWRQVRAPIPPEVTLQEETPAIVEAQEASLVPRFVYMLVALYAVTFAILSVLQHQSFQTNAFDLGNMDQAVWNTAHGRPLEFTNWEGGTNRLAAHVEPILFLVALTYHIYSSPVTLLVLQSIVISLGALPAFWLGRRVLQNSFAAAVFSFSYLLAPALEVANLADFHAVAFSSALLLFAFYFVYRQQYGWFLLFAVLAMATKEHVPMSVFIMGLYIAFVQGQRTAGYVTCGLAAVWAFVAFVIIIPHFNPEGVSPYLSRYDQLGKSPGDIAKTLLLDPIGTVQLLSQPPRVAYVQNLLLPTLFLALLSPATLAMALPDLAINLLSNFTESYAGRAHYGAVIVPFVTVSAILGAGQLHRLLSRVHLGFAQASVGVLSIAVLVSALVSYQRQVFLPLTDHLPQVSAHDERAKDILALIPPDAAVAASSSLNPHLSQREQISLFPDIRHAEYIALDVTASPYPIDAASQWWRVQQLLDGGEWGVVAARDGYLVLRRGAPGQSLPEEFLTFTKPIENAAIVRTDLHFGDDLRLRGYRLEPGTQVHGNDPFVQVTLYWQARQPLDDDFFIAVSLADEDGRVIYTDRFQPAMLWDPPSRWRPGETVQVLAPWLPLGTAQIGEVRVAVISRTPPYVVLDDLMPLDAEDGVVPLAKVTRG